MLRLVSVFLENSLAAIISLRSPKGLDERFYCRFRFSNIAPTENENEYNPDMT